MTFAIVGGGQLDTGYTIDNSLRFNQSDDPSLTRTPSSTGNRKTFTWSGWVKRGADFGTRQVFFGADNSADTNAAYIRFTDDQTIQAYIDNNNSLESNLNTLAKYRDVSAWYHVVWAVDTTQATSSDRSKIYVNGSQVTSFGTPVYPALNFDTDINTQEPHYVGGDTTGVANDYALDGYMAEVHFIDGTALDATSFGEFDEDSGIWKPIEYTGSYGTNGFYLDFEDSGSLGADQSGNGNNFTPTNLASTDQTTDTPTNNFATLNPLIKSVNTNSEGNLKSASTSGVWQHSPSTIAMSNGKWYFEVYLNSSTNVTMIGIADANSTTSTVDNDIDEIIVYRSNNGNKLVGGSYSSYGSTFTTGDIIGVALDMDSNNITFYKNNTSQGPISHSFSSVYFDTMVSDAASLTANFGQDSSFAGNETRQNNSDENGYGDFYYSPPSGYLALCTQNLATELSPTIDDGSAYFQTAIWSGTGASNSIVNNGNSDLQPDMIWFKGRSTTYDHRAYDSTRGTTVSVRPNTTDVENTLTNGTISYDTDGFTLGTAVQLNASGQTYVGWQWKANGGTTSSNSDGSITSTVQANTTAGFSIVTYTGTQANATVGHGLGVAPKFIITKCRSFNAGWPVYHYSLSATDFVRLNQTSGTATNSVVWNDTEPTSTVFTVGANDENNKSGGDQLAYCFAEIEGYSKFASYTGNGSTDGPFIYTGFRPAWLMIHRTDTSGENWQMFDNKRDGFNNASFSNKMLKGNNFETEDSNSTGFLDLLSNGFKIRESAARHNASGGTYIYMAFAETPFVSSAGVPVVAR